MTGSTWSDWSESVIPGELTAREIERESYNPEVKRTQAAWDILASAGGGGKSSMNC